MRLSAVALLLAAGCTPGSRTPTESAAPPRPELKSVAVLPVLHQKSGKASFDTEEFGDILASELLKFPGGFRVVRPAAYRGQPAPSTVDDALRLGRRQKVDAVLVVVITDHDPYDPPRIAVSVQLLRSSAGVISAAEVDRLSQCASWRRAPLQMSRDRAGHWIDAFEAVFDAKDGRIRSDLAAYARTQDLSGSAFIGEGEYLAVQPRYFQFVSHRLLQRVIGELADP